MKLRYAIFYVDDVKRTLEFYNTAFGLHIGFLHESGDYGELLTGDTKLAFSSIELMKTLGKSPSRPDPKSPSSEIAFETETVAEALAAAIEAGATLVQEAREEPWGQTTSYVTDINGFLVEICSPVASAG
ncbi:VOC family protein [Cognatishimia activa]|uniref:VOC family protein n=1 Tax=Cognatishimia activa TaxID=1715691 RepID=UPI00222E18DC|nr:VOC family protein [Cognatishimia activa]UZD90261.1 VOC family protein [Cognatishimia activa]